MTAIFQSFIPWILYFIIANSHYLSHEVAAISAVIATVIFSFRTLRKKFILDWGTLIYFIFLVILYLLPIRSWLSQYAFLLSSTVLALIMWFSIVIKRPFTIQYAREQVPEFVWLTPGFKFINYAISIVWAISMSLMALDGVLQSQRIITSFWINDAIIALLFIVAIVFTKQFPDWYQGYQFRKNSQELEDISANRFLNGNYAPVKDELFMTDLMVEGDIPEDLTGIYMRNGPNPEFHPISYTFPIDGDGMIHAVYISHGKASYRNRFIETKGLLAERKAGRALYGGIANIIPTDPKLVGKDGDPGPTKNGAFVHVIRHANQYLALMEASSAYLLSSDLKTINEWCPAGEEQPLMINAHTRLDPLTGHLSMFTYDVAAPPYLTYYELSKQGELIKKLPIDKLHSTMMHDFVTTENYILFFDCPAVFDINALATGDPVLTWRPELGARIGMMKKADYSIEWIETEVFWVYHFANAYEKGNQIVVDYVRHAQLVLGSDISKGDREPPTLYRAVIHCEEKKVSHQQLDDKPIEFPRINDLMNSKNYRYVYMPTSTTDNETIFNALVKYDLETERSMIHDFGEHIEIGEAVFAAADNSQAEDDGYMMLFTYNNQENSSEFVILNAQKFHDEPIARVKLPRRVPHGLHGSWLPGQW